MESQPKNENEDSEMSEDEDEDQNFTDSLMEMYKNRHKSPENLAKWQQIEKELFHEAIKKEDVPIEPLVENPQNPEQSAKIIATEQKIISVLPKQISADEGFITHSSTSNSSSTGSGPGKPGFRMSAAITNAMVTAAIPVTRDPGQNPVKVIPEIHALRQQKWQKQRSITVIEEVSA